MTATASFEEDPYYTDCRLKNPNNEYMTNEQIEELLQSDDEDFDYTTWQRLSDNKRCFFRTNKYSWKNNQLIMSSHFISSLSRLLFFPFSTVPGFFTNILFYSITLQGNKLTQDSFFVTKIWIRIKLPVIMNGTVNGFPILNSDSGKAIHTAVSRYQHVSWTDSQSKSDIPITGNQKTMCWACVNILFIFVLKAIFNPIKNVFKPNKGKNRLINLMQHWRMHWIVSMVEFPVELSLITLRKPKMSGKNVGWRQNLGLRNRFKKVQNLFCRTYRTLNLTLKFGAKKVRLVRDCIRYMTK